MLVERNLTVVYTVNDQEAFAGEHKKLMEKFQESEGKPWAITAMSNDHELQRLHWIEEALDENDIEAAQAAISHPNISSIKSLAELQEI